MTRNLEQKPSLPARLPCKPVLPCPQLTPTSRSQQPFLPLTAMLVSALLTSVGINLALCVFFFALYSILRKQPSNVKIYSPRLLLLSQGRTTPAAPSLVDRLLPSTYWVRAAWLPTEEDLLSSAGFDALVLMRIFVFSLKVFAVAGVIGVFVLLPINYNGDELHSFDFFDIPNQSLDRFSISNIKDGSNWLWVHFSAGYVFTGIVCYLLYLEYGYLSAKRLEYFCASELQPQQFTILVRGIPRSSGRTFSETIDQFFTEHYPSSYLSHLVVCQTSKVRALINDGEAVYRKLLQLESKRHTPEGSNFLGLFGNKSDLIGHYGKKLEELEENVRLEQSSISTTRKEIPAAFVCFRSRYSAAAVIHMPQSTNPTQWITEKAPEPRDVYWPNFSGSFMRRWILRLVVYAASVFLIVVFLIPVLCVQGLTNLAQLKALFPFLENILSITVVSQVVTGYLPSLILQLFLSVVPPIMIQFSKMQGYISYSDIERSSCSKMLWFTVWNIFFANVLSGSVASQVEVFLDPRDIPRRLAVAVPAQASFFIAYVVTSGWTSLSSELTRIVALLGDFMRRHCLKCLEHDFQAPSVKYHSAIPQILFFGLLGITYFLLAPVILPFLLVYYCLGYIIYRNQLLNVYVPKYETGGKFWPTVHNAMIFSLSLMQVIAIGIFGLKHLPLASGLTFPLLVLTLVFNDYCRKRFLPIFNAYPAESLIKKDRSDQNDAAMADFFNKLVTAYNDPALLPVRYSASTESRTSPLLSDPKRA